MSNYFVGYSTQRNEYQVWNNQKIVCKTPNPRVVVDYLIEEYKRLVEKPVAIVIGLPDLEKRIIKALDGIQSAQMEMEQIK